MDFIFVDAAAKKHPLAYPALKEVKTSEGKTVVELAAFCNEDDNECKDQHAEMKGMSQEMPASVSGDRLRVHAILRPFSKECLTCVRNPRRKEE